MENYINIGIDLGTTNSAIARFNEGHVHLYSNPADRSSYILPSVVAFYEDRIVTGKKARELQEKAPQNVIGRFKRKMGTTEKFTIESIGSTKTPVDLSAIILKELKTFLPPGEFKEAAVVTIPASFDTLQANATKEAAARAGFMHVLLLQEPIAASLAYANQKKATSLPDGRWLVYDLGGGTFDVALVSTRDGEMKVLDHEGNNFLGGTDFDNLIIEKLVIPAITARYQFSNLEADMKSASGKYNAAYFVLLQKAEEAKIILSARSAATIAVEGITDEHNQPVDMEVTITREAFNDIISWHIADTIGMISNIITRNQLTAADISFILMVGGSTYIPYVRQQIETVLQIEVNYEIDPISAVAMGAAYYASTQPWQSKHRVAARTNTLAIKATYAKASREKEELFLAKVTGAGNGYSYRIKREDGGFDTGLKTLKERISEYLPLVENMFNQFTLSIYDNQNNHLPTDEDIIRIDSGFSINGQPIPEDICLEIDDENNPGVTRLLPVFYRNHILPSRKTITRVLNKTISPNINDVIRINVLEGAHTALPEANKSLGYLEIAGNSVTKPVLKGTDIELTFHLSESRDLTVTAYLNMADQEFTQTFTPEERNVSIPALQIDMKMLSEKLEKEIYDANAEENFTTGSQLATLKKEMDDVAGEAGMLSTDDVTDKRYQLEDKKRRLAQTIGDVTAGYRVTQAIKWYYDIKENCAQLLARHGKDSEQQYYYSIISPEAEIIQSRSLIRIYEKADALLSLRNVILWRVPEFLTSSFHQLATSPKQPGNDVKVKTLLETGHIAIGAEDWPALVEVNQGLIALLPKNNKDYIFTKVGF